MDYNVIGSLEESLMMLWVEVMSFLPQLVIALLIVIIGWFVGSLLGKLVQKVLQKLRLQELLEKADVNELVARAGYDFHPERFLGALVKWFVILAFVVVALDILRLQEVTTFMREVVLGYLPQVFVAVLILLAAMVIAGLARKTLAASLRAGGATVKAELLSRLAYYLIIAFGVMAALNQLRIADDLIQTLFMGIVFALALAAGLAFGLGGKDAAGRYIDQITKR
jgi:small-conductance mechanosensitive channel